METQVYINDREASSKASDGVSKAAFPDPCWTPPSPPAGPIIVPYPNTAYASTMKAGTTTVFICNSMVAKEDISYFSTSTGDEGATQTQPKGVKTGVIKGKAYFKSWSPNVKFEGKCVARHEDLMTHNHGSDPGNTLVTTYRDTLNMPEQCKKEEDRIRKACKPDEDKKDDDKNKQDNDKKKQEDERRKNHVKNKNLMKLMGKEVSDKLASLDDKVRSKYARIKTPENEWIFSHCSGLWIKPRFGLDEYNKLLKELTEDFNKKVASLIEPMLTQLKQEIIDKAKDAALHKAEKLAVHAAGRWAVGTAGAAVAGVGAVVTETIATIWNVCDAIGTANDTAKLGVEAYKKLNEIKDILSLVEQAKAELEATLKDMTPSQMMATGMGALARINPCTRARRCLLVDYNKTGTKPSIETGEGCCPGQTGHHLIPDEMAKGHCSGYTKGSAPTVCVEGTNNDNGTHGKMHDEMVKGIKQYRNSGWFSDKDKIDYEDAKEIALDGFEKMFPESRCSKSCLRKQLDNYYKQCDDNMPAVAGKAFTDDDVDSQTPAPSTGNKR
ncbi:DUF4150 domain-containing protein [Citrobacter freundii]|uniref:PAAR-like domain-containing protein n=1 Tax=Citrobacter TaxID=544 RepID=UPI00122FC7B7|nr:MULTISPECIES: PAAR-like domain-containing protein [Citrobacter]EKL0722938.1 DUF4150 domain-containing protein [Citrobacter freundii]EKW2051819.1 DUF4150 domain-containing protein [Citrobacter freundii]KAA3564576.1 DUF4150 domain-containing protein [Citrobacter freundii]MBA8048838.1 DUF4150 domain-containing protein [Citrobacter freundii]MBJ8976260.1 DUF4150 domain-containing protein [Citrobacter freundii]